MEYIDGRVLNLKVIASFTEAIITWDYVGGTTQHKLLVLLDGDIQAILPAEARSYSLSIFDSAQHSIDVVPIKSEVAILPDFHGNQYGRRAYIKWAPSVSEDTVAYRVYQDTSFVTIDTIAVHTLSNALPKTGNGAGRINVSGTYVGAPINKVFTIEIASSGCRHNIAGSWSAYTQFAQGDSLLLPYDIRLEFLDPRANYLNGDTYQFRVGPLTSYLSDVLTAGTKTFTIKAVDAAGNESTGASVSVAIFHKPDDVTNPAASWDGTYLSLSWANGGTNEILIYSNYSKTFGLLKDHIIMDAPFQIRNAGQTSYSFSPTVQGNWQFLIRTRDAQGRMSDGIQAVSVDTTGLPTGVRLNVPESIAVRPIAGGKFNIKWNYRLQDGEDIAACNVYIYNNNLAPEFINPVNVTANAASVSNVLTFSIDTEASFIGAQYITVRATDGILETTNIDNVPGIPDGQAPNPVASILAASS